MSDSSLVEYRRLTKKYTRRLYPISKITIHHSASVHTGKQIADFFAESTKAASANYCIGVRGDIALSVPEEYRAWTSSNKDNDHKAITIEVSNSKIGGDYPISDDSYESLINLCVDICQRNNIKSVYYDGTPAGVLTEHRMFAATLCPGPYIHNLLVNGSIASQINARLRPQTISDRIYDGIDLSPVFNATYYGGRYPDLLAAGLKSPDQLWMHFITFGMLEARQASADFSPVTYRNTNPDLNAAFGDDWEAYYKHYCMVGKAEIESGQRKRMY